MRLEFNGNLKHRYYNTDYNTGEKTNHTINFYANNIFCYLTILVTAIIVNNKY